MRVSRRFARLLQCAVVVACVVSTIVILPPNVAATGGTCLYCASPPAGAAILTTTIIASVHCGKTAITLGPQMQFGASVDTAQFIGEAYACNGGSGAWVNGNYEFINTAGANGFSWTSHVSKVVTVTVFWNVSWTTNISLSQCAIGDLGHSHSVIQVNGSSQDHTSGAAPITAATNVADVAIPACSTTASQAGGSASTTPVAFTVAFTFTATNNHVYYFDTRLIVHLTAYYAAGTATTPPQRYADAYGVVGSGPYSAKLSSLEVY